MDTHQEMRVFGPVEEREGERQFFDGEMVEMALTMTERSGEEDYKSEKMTTNTGSEKAGKESETNAVRKRSM